MRTSAEYRKLRSDALEDYISHLGDDAARVNYMGNLSSISIEQNRTIEEHEKREKITKNLVSLAAILAAMRVLKKRHNNKEINKLFDELEEINDKIKNISKKRILTDQDTQKVSSLQAEAKMIETKIKRISKI